LNTNYLASDYLHIYCCNYSYEFLSCSKKFGALLRITEKIFNENYQKSVANILNVITAL